MDEKFDISKERQIEGSEFYKDGGKFKRCFGKDITVSCAMDDFSGKWFDKSVGKGNGKIDVKNNSPEFKRLNEYYSEFCKRYPIIYEKSDKNE